MPGIELSTLNAEELRSLLSAARRRENSTLADDVAAELAARSRRPAQWAGGAVLAEPQDGARPRTLSTLLGVVAAAALAIGLGWQLARPEVPAPAAPVLPVVVAPSTPLPLPPPPPSAEKLEVLPRADMARSQPLVRAPPAPTRPPPSVVIGPSPRVETLPPPPVRAEAPVEPLAAPGASGPEQRLRLAYERALETGIDPRAIDRGQARWRQKLARTRDPDRRSALYARRIGELEAAARWNGGR